MREKCKANPAACALRDDRKEEHMSVYKSKRGESIVQFIETARQLEAHTLACCMKAPKRYSFLLTQRMEDIRTAYESWRGHMRRGNSWRVLRRMDRYYNRLFA